MEKKTSDRGVVDSIAALRLRRYNEKGPGAARARPPKPPSIEKLRAEIAKVPAVKPKNKSKKGKRR